MRPYLTERRCKGLEPHPPHKWDVALDPFADEFDPRFYCRGVEDVAIGETATEALGEVVSTRATLLQRLVEAGD